LRNVPPTAPLQRAGGYTISLNTFFKYSQKKKKKTEKKNKNGGPGVSATIKNYTDICIIT